MIRKGDTKDANDAERDDKTSQEKRVCGNQAKRIAYYYEESGHWKNSDCSKAMKKGLEQAILKQTGVK